MQQTDDEIKFFNKAKDVEELLQNEINILGELLKFERYNESYNNIKKLTEIMVNLATLKRNYIRTLDDHLRQGRDNMVMGMQAGKAAAEFRHNPQDDNTNWDLMDDVGEMGWTQD